MKQALYLSILLLLAACGGGEPEPGDRTFIGPPDCANHPEACT